MTACGRTRVGSVAMAIRADGELVWQELEAFDLTPALLDRARRAVASAALDVDDARELLAALGLLTVERAEGLR